MPIELLFLRADESQIPNSHIEAFKVMCQTNGISVREVLIKSANDLRSALTGTNKYIIFAGHGNHEEFGSFDSVLSIKWSDIADILCTSNCFRHDAKILLYCCEGGLHTVGCTIMNACPNLNFIAGPKKKQNSIHLLNAYNVFLYNMQINQLDDEESIHRAMAATDIEFEHFYKDEIDNETGEEICAKCEEYKTHSHSIF